ncbi:MAG: hypothetical protein OQK12_02825 [Motiliproteus sp.]|nr:hypothetical protein [Motiliproteus sp.]MCW9053956.1 hypothetical protein [Motiliproteus sp.]
MKNLNEQQQKKKNTRLAIALGAFALLVLVTSFPFWQAVLVEISKSN